MGVACVAYEMRGGPLDGGTYREEGDPLRDGMVYEVLYEGVHLYRSNGPVDVLETVVGMDYAGRMTPDYDRPDVVVVRW